MRVRARGLSPRTTCARVAFWVASQSYIHWAKVPPNECFHNTMGDYTNAFFRGAAQAVVPNYRCRPEGWGRGTGAGSCVTTLPAARLERTAHHYAVDPEHCVPVGVLPLHPFPAPRRITRPIFGLARSHPPILFLVCSRQVFRGTWLHAETVQAGVGVSMGGSMGGWDGWRAMGRPKKGGLACAACKAPGC